MVVSVKPCVSFARTSLITDVDCFCLPSELAILGNDCWSEFDSESESDDDILLGYEEDSEYYF